MKRSSSACRHRQSWIIGGHLEWCHGCGAFRHLRDICIGLAVVSPWCRPGEAPEAFESRRAAYAKASETRRLRRSRVRRAS